MRMIDIGDGGLQGFGDQFTYVIKLRSDRRKWLLFIWTYPRRRSGLITSVHETRDDAERVAIAHDQDRERGPGENRYAAAMRLAYEDEE